MSVSATAWLWLGALGMGLATLVPLSRLRSTDENRTYLAVLVAITGVAAVAYTVMALGYGTAVVAGSRIELVRYVDWLITTPLMVLYLGILVRPSRRLLAALVGADIVVILAGVTADVLGGGQTGGPPGLGTGGLVAVVPAALVFLVGVAAFGVLVYLLVGPLPKNAAVGPECRMAFSKLRNLTVVLWTLYPVVWLLSTSGFGLLTVPDEAFIVMYLDIISKGGFVVMATRRRAALAELAGAEVSMEGVVTKASDPMSAD